MNYAQKILSYLSESKRFSQMFLVAGAPPVEKVGQHFSIVINTVLTPEDIQDTLGFFQSQATQSERLKTEKQGIISVGIPNQGRFRIQYMTQRGSPFMVIRRLPFDPPKLETILADAGQAAMVDDMLTQSPGKIFFFTSTSQDSLSRIIYASLARLNDKKNKVVLVLDQELSYLMKHRNSIMIQVEVGTDVPTLSDGIRNALVLAPDLIYVNNPRTPEDFVDLMCAAQAGATVMASMVTVNIQYLISDLEKRMQGDFPLLQHFIKQVIAVTTNPEGLVILSENDISEPEVIVVP